MDLKKCVTGCKKVLPLDLFYDHKSTPDGKANSCKKCFLKMMQKKRAIKKIIEGYSKFSL